MRAQGVPARGARLHAAGELEETDLHDNYVTFMAGIFRSIRFGASSAHGKANMVRFNYFEEQGAFVRDAETGTYSVDFEVMQEAMSSLSNLLLTLQGNGDGERDCRDYGFRSTASVYAEGALTPRCTHAWAAGGPHERQPSSD